MSETALMVPISDVQTLANSVARSRLFPAFDSPEKALVLMMLAQAEGCSPIQATQRYDIIQGRPAKKTDAMLADFQKRAGTVKWLELSANAVEAEFTAKGLAAPVRVRWDMARANLAGLGGKDMWKKFPQNMLRARVVSEGIRLADPGVVAGLYTPEEVQDFDAPPANVNATPAAPQAEAKPAPVEAEVLPPDEPKARPEAIKALCASMTKLGIRDREDVLAWCEQRIGRKIGSRKDLTVSECSRLIDESKTPAPEPRQPGED